MSAGKSISAQERSRMLRQHSANGWYGLGKDRPKLNYSGKNAYIRYRSEPARRTGRSEELARKLFFIVFELSIGVILDLLKRYTKSWTNSLKKEAAFDGTPLESAGPNVSKIASTSGLSGRTIGQTSSKTKSAAHIFQLLRRTASQWNQDKCPQLGAALAYYTIFSLAPLILLLLGIFGLVYGGSEPAREKILEQLRYLLDPSALKVIQDIANNSAQRAPGILATGFGIVIALFGASGIFGQLQDALNTIWRVKPKPGQGIWGFLRARFLSFAMVAGVCFLLLVSLTVEGVLKGLHAYLQTVMPGGHYLGLAAFYLFDFAIISLLFAMIFRYLPDAKVAWNDVWTGALLTAILFVIGKFLLGLYLGSGAAGSAFGAASSLITLLLWIFYSAQILLFGAEFTKIYADFYGSPLEPEPHAVLLEKIEVELPKRSR
jgi:membrane protein